MKKNIITILFTAFSLIITYGQINNGEIIYKKIKLKKRFTEKNKNLSKERIKKFSEIENKMDEIQKNTLFILLFDGRQSSFEAEKNLENKQNKFIKGAIGPDASGFFYNHNDKIIRKLHAFGQDFLIHKKPYKWRITNEKKKIGKYECIKAELEKNIQTKNGIKKIFTIAWFTKEINIPYGPIGYSGLPGLIIELESNNFLYYVHKINLNIKKNVKIKEPRLGKKVSDSEFSEIAYQTMSSLKKRKS